MISDAQLQLVMQTVLSIATLAILTWQAVKMAELSKVAKETHIAVNSTATALATKKTEDDIRSAEVVKAYTTLLAENKIKADFIERQAELDQAFREGTAVHNTSVPTEAHIAKVEVVNEGSVPVVVKRPHTPEN